MKNIILSTILAMSATTALAGPNNYIYTDDSGVVYEQDGGSTPSSGFSGTIISRDMATQLELDQAVSNLSYDMSTLAAASAASASIQMDPSHQGFQVGVGLGYSDSQYQGAVGMGFSLGDRSFGYMSVDTQGTVGASVNWRF